MLATALLAITMAAGGNAPASVDGMVLDYQITKATGLFQGEAGQAAVTSFTGDHYVDADRNGKVSDRGTYTYQVTGSSDSVVVYHPTGGQWTGGDYTEKLHWSSATGGSVKGTPAGGTGVYKGSFRVKQ
jgi:hypothetical protein